VRTVLLWIVVASVLVGCESDVKTHQMYYGTGSPRIDSITIGEVDAVKTVKKRGPVSPSIVLPNQLAAIKMVCVLKGQGVGKRIALAFESGRSNEPAPMQRYVFFWDEMGRCVKYFTVKDNFYLKDGVEISLDELKVTTTRP
jgi:hypothetical protein